jgi:hypothetical protein
MEFLFSVKIDRGRGQKGWLGRRQQTGRSRHCTQQLLWPLDPKCADASDICRAQIVLCLRAFCAFAIKFKVEIYMVRNEQASSIQLLIMKTNIYETLGMKHFETGLEPTGNIV